VGVTVTGAKETETALNKLAKDLFDVEVPNGLEEIVNFFVETAQGNAPVDTGFLRDNIAIESLDKDSAIVTSGAEYSIFVEEGTSNMSPQPFMQPALAETENEATKIMNAKVTASIRENIGG
jgi:HK97 gp10 family phage protein